MFENYTNTREKPECMEIDARGIYYRELNSILKDAVLRGIRHIKVTNVYGQRYIGTNLNARVILEIYGVPGNDLGAFMNQPEIIVHGNAQDGCGNTMNDGTIIIHGNAGDITGLAARGGKIFIKGNVGYRAGIHMKEYGDRKPILVIGGTAQDFLGEYMAGGILILLGLNLKENEKHRPIFIGTGMHGGKIFIRGHIEPHQVGKEVGIDELNVQDNEILSRYVSEFAEHFNYGTQEILNSRFVKLYPKYLRPYGKLYAY